jgi:hypothetical protein
MEYEWKNEGFLEIMGRNGGNFIAMFDYRRKNAMDGSSHVFPATQNNHFRRGVRSFPNTGNACASPWPAATW